MNSPEIERFMELGDESHEAARILMDHGILRFSAAQKFHQRL
jgi:hypothetical protein